MRAAIARSSTVQPSTNTFTILAAHDQRLPYVTDHRLQNYSEIKRSNHRQVSKSNRFRCS